MGAWTMCLRKWVPSTFNTGNGKYKIYVRKWSDILQTEWGYKMKYLKEKLELKLKDNSDKTPDDIVKD